MALNLELNYYTIYSLSRIFCWNFPRISLGFAGWWYGCSIYLDFVEGKQESKAKVVKVKVGSDVLHLHMGF